MLKPLHRTITAVLDTGWPPSPPPATRGPDAAATVPPCRAYANAYTVGQHIVFGEGRFAPATEAGRELLAHELAHVIQQERGGAAPPPLGGGMLEQAADAAASAFVTGRGA